MPDSVGDLRIDFNVEEGVVLIHHHIESDWAIFDICDVDGRVIKTGPIPQSEEEIKIKADLTDGESYMMYVMDGEKMYKGRFKVQ